MAQNQKLKLMALITKLSDRDTYASASAELESLARGLDASPSALPSFLACVLSAGPTDKPQARRQCLHLISTLSLLYPAALAPHLPKLLAFLTLRLRDSDSSVLRPQCVSTAASLSKNLSKVSFFNAFAKPLSEALFTEQEIGSQIGVAACLSAAVEAAADPEPGKLGRGLVPKLERVLKSEGYKGKAGALGVLGSVIWVGGIRGYGGLSVLVGCLVGFLKSEDWASRKAAAEALRRLAVVERDSLAEFKIACMKVFESRRFDKVKAAREVMNQMIEAWKQVPDVSDEASPPPRSMGSSRDDASDRRYPVGSKVPSATPRTAGLRKKINLSGGKTPCGGSSSIMSRTRGPLISVEKKLNAAMFGKRSSNQKVVDAVSGGTSFTGLGDASLKERNDALSDRRNVKPETKRALFNKNTSDNMSVSVGTKSGSRGLPSHEGSLGSTAAAGDVNENKHVNHKECNDFSSIRNQLLQIERQQSSLLDLIQSFMGSSQNGMRALENRVQGLEFALDDISYDLAASAGRMTNPRRMSCCLLPGTDFFSSKLLRKSGGRCSTSGFLPGGTLSFEGLQHRSNQRRLGAETFNLESHRLRLQGGRGVIVNPLAEIQVEARGVPVVVQN